MLAVELYSGIGGFHYALDALKAGTVRASIDINTTANAIYKHNFPSTKLMQKNIQGLNAKDMEDFNADIIWMSPPCQPYTRLGLKKDIHDNRSLSYLHVIHLLSGLKKKPELLMLENVKGFETSEGRDRLVDMLTEADYSFQEFLLNPIQFGIPNSRLRYYMVAQLNGLWKQDKLLKSFPTCATHCCCVCHDDDRKSIEGKDSCKHVDGPYCIFCSSSWQHPCVDDDHSLLVPRGCGLSLSSYVTSSADGDGLLLLGDEVLAKNSQPLDIVYSDSRRSCCFTKSYGHLVKGTGSVFTSCSPDTVRKVYEEASTQNEMDERLQLLKTLRLRHFSPEEMSRLMGFPPSFSFPEDLSRIQRYRVLGNSLNVRVVTALLKWVLRNKSDK